MNTTTAPVPTSATRPGIHVLLADGRAAIVTIQPGRRGGLVLVLSSGPTTFYAQPVGDVTRAALQTLLDPGTATTVLDFLAEAPRDLRFDENEYRLAHGRRPAGRGLWAFRPAGIKHRDDAPVFAPGDLTLTEARAWLALQPLRPTCWVICS